MKRLLILILIVLLTAAFPTASFGAEGGPADSVIVTIPDAKYIPAEDLLADNDDLIAGYIEKETAIPDISPVKLRARSVGSRLTGANLAVYNVLKRMIIVQLV